MLSSFCPSRSCLQDFLLCGRKLLTLSSVVWLLKLFSVCTGWTVSPEWKSSIVHCDSEYESIFCLKTNTFLTKQPFFFQCTSLYKYFFWNRQPASESSVFSDWGDIRQINANHYCSTLLFPPHGINFRLFTERWRIMKLFSHPTQHCPRGRGCSSGLSISHQDYLPTGKESKLFLMWILKHLLLCLT